MKGNHGYAVAVHDSRGGEVKTEQKGCRLDAGLDGRHLAASQQILQERRTTKTIAKTTVFDSSNYGCSLQTDDFRKVILSSTFYKRKDCL